MARLVEDMLTLAKLDEQRPIARRPVDLARLAHDAGADARAIAPDRVIDVVADERLTVVGDEDRLRQVFANVVNNAVSHTEPGVPVSISARAVGDRAVVEVTDAGDGMPAEVATRVTERFFRADPSRSRHRGGSGLGLSIVESTVDAHGGSFEIRSTPGHGTTVSVSLPLDH
jgi:two-component system OmpR family sensor kinase